MRVKGKLASRVAAILCVPIVVALLGVSLATAAPAPPPVSTITFVQVNSATPQSPSATVTVPFTKAQTAGNLSVVVVGWNDSTSQVQSVTDSKGNVYTLAVGPTVSGGFATQSIYYAKNILAAAAGANSVTVTFSTAAAFPDIRILEYSGVDTSTAVDATSSAVGSSTSSATGPMTTLNANDLLFAANMVGSLTSSAGTGFTSRIITPTDLDIAEDRLVSATGSYTATANVSPSANWIMQMVAFRAAGSPPPPPPDTTPPSVSVTSPTAGATLSNTVTFTATSTDSGTGVAGVQFQVDGIGVGGPDTASPYSISFDSTQFANGSHVVTAYSWDNAGNMGTSAPVTVTFSNTNPGNPAKNGYSSTVTNWPVVTVHTNLLPNGKVFAWDGQALGALGTVWDPVTGIFITVTSPNNLFCAGHAGLPDGRVMSAGGHAGAAHVGLPAGQIFDPATNSWSTTPDMANARWYPTVTALPDGRMLVTSGETNCDGCDVAIPEIYNPATNSWSALSSAQWVFPYYPHAYVLPDGRILVVATAEEPIVSQILDLAANTWTAIGGSAVDGGSSVMYLPGKFLKTGTSANPDLSARASASNAYLLDTTKPSPTWTPVAPMAFPRTYHTLTSLPDGKVLVTGGGNTTAPTLLSGAISQVELWDPATQTFTTLGTIHNPRLYHSIGLLMPDARVLISGGGRFDGQPNPAVDQQNGEIYSPPYLFKGPRPSITSAPGTWQYGQNVTVQTPDAGTIATVSLIRIGNVTHAINMSQRYLPLTFTVGSNALTVTAPANANLAPPGVYMLFLVNNNGVPSVASIVNFGTPAADTQPPTIPTGLAATAGVGSVSLTWNASTDNVGVAGYHVYRSTTSGFTASPSTLIANVTATNFTDVGLAAGTYFYLVSAFDAAGNTSAASNQASATVAGDTTPPSAPASLVATASSASQIGLTWAASTDNVGVTGYRVERCQGAGCTTFTQIATPAGTSFNDSGLLASTSYSYRVRATDAAGNLSGYSNVATVSTQAGPPPTGTITFVQVNAATPQGSASSVNITFNAAQTAGDLNVVAVGWNDATHLVNSVTDTKGNLYMLAVGPTVNAAGGLSQSIYYAKNIAPAAAGANTVTVVFNSATPFPDVRILEYNGADLTTPVDVTAMGSGSGAASTTTAVATANANDLLFAANLVSTTTGAAGAGFTSRIITAPDGDIAEDRLVAATGSYTASATLTPSGAWVIQMVAFRVASATPPPDTTPPTAPTNLSASAASLTQIALSWTNSTDNVGVTNYLLERCQGTGCSSFTQVATTTGNAFSDTGLTTVATYSYRVRATDAAGNLSPYSNIATATPDLLDTTPPSAPTNLTLTPTSSSQISLSWTASTDNVGVTGYLIARCPPPGLPCSADPDIGTSSTTTFLDSGLSPSTTYAYLVRATDAAGNISNYSVAVQATTLASTDTTPPTAPTNLTATAVSSTQANLAWTAATDNVGVTGYRVERCQGAGCTVFAEIARPTTTTYSDLALQASNIYVYRVRANDAAGNLGNYSATASVTTPAVADTTPPTAPTNLTATIASSTQINLSWTASTDNVGVTGYRVERCQGASCTTFAQIATPTTTSLSDTGLTPSTSYSYRVRATDAAGNLSNYSTTSSAITPAAPDTTPPTAPSGLTATATGSTQINLAWTASTDNVGVTGYLVERCQGAGCTTFAQIATPTTTSFGDSALLASTSYSYRVRATDAAGNLSSYSSVATATTQSGTTTGNISFVQVNAATPQSSTASVGITFTAAQAAGDLNVVVVGWNDSTAIVNSVADSKGNTYALAAGPMVVSGAASQAIYYASNINPAAAGANTVAITFSQAAAFPDVRILEYSGIDPVTPLDGSVSNSGNSSTSSSGNLTTTKAKDLLLAANLVLTATTGPGTGFTTRVITNPDADIAEDRLVTATGTYSATAPINPGGIWIMQMVAFRASGQ